MKLALPWEILKQGCLFLITRSGLLLVLVGLAFSLIFGLGSLIIKYFILGPMLVVFQDSLILFWIILPILYGIFFVFLFAFGIIAQFVMLFFLSRHEKKEEPLLSFQALKSQKETFGFYIKTSFYVLSEIIIGLLKGVLPGIRNMANFFFVGPLFVFEETQNISTEEILNRCNHLMESKRQEFFYFALLHIAVYIFSLLMLGQFFAQIFLIPFLFTYFAYGVVQFYKQAKS